MVIEEEGVQEGGHQLLRTQKGGNPGEAKIQQDPGGPN